MKNYHKKTVLQVLPSLISGGVERGTVDISQALIEHGFNSIIASNGGPLAEHIINHKAQHLTLPVNSKNPIKLIKNITLLMDVINEYKVDIIHARSRAPAWSSYFAAQKTDKRFITTFHGTYNYNNFFKKYYNSIMTKGERIIAVSEFIKKHIIENYKVNEEKIRLIHRGVDLNLFDPLKVDSFKVEELKTFFKVPENTPIILLPGRFTLWKGQQLLVEALKEIKKMDFYCLIVGDQSKHQEFTARLSRQIEESGLKQKVHLAGPVYDMVSLYSMSDIIISASIEPEAFGRIAIEAQAMKKIIITSKCGGACETVKDEVSGFHVEPNNKFDLAEKIKFALSILGSKREKDLTSFARESVNQHFSLEVMKQKTIEVYKELI